MQKHKQEVSFNIFKHISSKINPKHVPTPPNVSGFHLNPSYNKTQAFTWPKTYQNERSMRNLKMRKVWKTYRLVIRMWFFGRYVNEGGGSINLTTPLQQVRKNASEKRTYEVFLALGAIEGDEGSLKRKWKNEGVWREWENQMMWEKERRGKLL